MVKNNTMSKYPKLKEEIIITDPETLKVIGDPLRLQIMKTFKNPRTVKEISEILDIAQTKLYYHVNMLKKHNLIEVVETNVVSGIIEKKYRVTAARYGVKDTLLSTVDDPESHIDSLLNAIFDSDKDEIRKSIRADLMDLNDQSDATRGVLVHTSLNLTNEQVKEFMEKISAVMKEYNEQADENDDMTPDATVYGLTFALFPVHRPKDE
jgi:DNA-binding transcriptional ArsR family regulator